MKNKIKKFFKNKLIKNIGYVFSGSILGSILGLINTGILVKALGLEKNGIIFLGLSYIGLFNALFNFQSYEAIIKFLPGNMDSANQKGKNYILLGFYFDILTALLAFCFAFLLIIPIGKYLKWNPEIIQCIRILSISILFTLTGTCTGILRIFSKFKEIAYINIIKNIFLLIMFLIGLFFQQILLFYIICEVFSFFLVMVFMFFFAIRTLKENNMCCFKIKPKYDKNFIEFAIYSNINVVLDLPIFHLTIFIINKYVGFSEISVYKILEKMGTVLKQATNIISQVMMPEISKAITAKENKKVYNWAFKIGIFSILIGISGLILTIFTKQYWMKYFIPNYFDFIPTIYLYIFYIIFTTAFIFQHPIFIYSGHVKKNTVILFISNSFYLVLVIFLTKKIGINGIIISLILQAGMVFLIKGIVLHRYNKSL